MADDQAKADGVPAPAEGGSYTASFPVDSADVTQLSMDELRLRRKELSNCESHVSYWRRIIQARLDLIAEGVVKHGASKDGLQRVLSHRLGVNNRLGLLAVGPQGKQPLAGLDHLWHRSLTASPDEEEALEAELRDAEKQLSHFRAALHEQIDEATAELIRRYREDPGLVDAILPTRDSRPAPL